MIDDPANEDVADFLAEHLVDGDPDPELVWDMEDPDDVAAYEAAQLTWSEGGQQRAAAYAAKND